MVPFAAQINSNATVNSIVAVDLDMDKNET